MRDKVIIICLLVLFGATSWIAFGLYQEGKQDKQRIATLVKNQGKAAIVDKYVRDSIPHTVFRDNIIKDDEAEKQLAITATYADSLEQALKISLSKINQVTKVNAKLQAEIQLKNDSVYQDKWLTLRYLKDSAKWQLDYDISLNIARYSERSWFLAPKQHYIDVFADDPRVKIKGLKTFTIREKQPRRLGLGIQAGYGFHLNNNQVVSSPYIGIGLNYNLIQF